MACKCKKREESGSVVSKQPDDPCVFCAHKHIAAARQLYDLELGYKHINQSHAIGQMILAAWHWDKEHHHLALRCREIWLKMEQLQDASAELAALQEAAWNLAAEEAEKTNNKNGETNHG